LARELVARAEAGRLPGFEDVAAAAGRLRGRVLRTPVGHWPAIDAMTERRVHFKCENVQHGSAFKYRGALNAVLQLVGRTDVRAVATHSSGNHGTALALAARTCGLAAYVVTPRDSAPNKIAAVRAAGGVLTFCEPGMAAREAALEELLQRESAHLVHPFDDGRVIAGQGTAAVELLADVADLEVVCVPVGGGGLLGGTALAVKALAPSCTVVGAEPAQADDAFRSFKTGVRQAAGTPSTIADGLRGSIGVLNFELLRRFVDDIVTVSEAEIVEAMQIIRAETGLAIEPSSAVAVAALVAGRLGRRGQRVGIVVSGGNV
jgi:threonine dehydratase